MASVESEVNDRDFDGCYGLGQNDRWQGLGNPCGPPVVIQKRLACRTGQFMNPALLPDQFDILEPPEDAIRVDVTGSPEENAGEIRRKLEVNKTCSARVDQRGRYSVRLASRSIDGTQCSQAPGSCVIVPGSTGRRPAPA